MPDQNLLAIAEVDAWLMVTYPGAARAEPWRLLQHGYGAGASGWTVPVADGTSLLIAVDHGFPYTNPSTAVFGPDAPARAPHVEDDCRLCTLGATARTDSRDPVGVVREYINQSVALLADVAAGKHEEDFLVDFNAYWRRDQNRPRAVWTLIEMAAPTRAAFSWREGSRFIVCDDGDRLARWLSNISGRPFHGQLAPSLFLWFDRLPVPTEYPSTIVQLRQMVAQRAPDGLALLDEILGSADPNKCVVFSGTTGIGTTGSGTFYLDRSSRTNGVAGRPLAIKGFRPGKAPAHVIAQSTVLGRASTTAMDAAITRLPSGILAGLSKARVSLIGCGALGSGVARLLVQSGVKRMRLFDPDALGWENIGRHELGAASIGKNKAAELAAILRRRLPECEVVGLDGDWRAFFRGSDTLWAEDDLIISATADWGSDCALSDLQVAGQIVCPVLFGWMERNAAATHALALAGNKTSFRHGFDATGNANRPVTSWWEDEKIPGCGAGTSAYGAIELGMACSHVADMAMELLLGSATSPVWRVQITSTPALERAGGYWSTSFQAAVGDPGMGRRSFALDW